MKKLTFIHAADLHLDSPMIGLKHLPQSIFQKLQESTFESLTKIVDAAIISHVDFVIFAGDLFDREDRSIKAQSRFRKEMKRLAEMGIKVFVLHGNHDHLDARERTHLSMPDNVHIFSQHVEEITFISSEGVSAKLYGFSYPKRHVFERMIDHYEKTDDADFHIGILHGSYEGSSGHGKYAPFTLKELLEKGFDYWALGHIHKREILYEQPPIIYPGNTQGRNKKETGRKGCYFVQLTEEKADLEFIETSAVIWETVTIDASDAASFQDIYIMCKEVINHNRDDQKGIILSIDIINVNISKHEMKDILNGELIDLLQEEEKEETAFIWLSNITVSEKMKWSRQQLANESDFFHELFNISGESENLDHYVSVLYEHPIARKYLEELSKEEKMTLVKEAENLLVKLLHEK